MARKGGPLEDLIKRSAEAQGLRGLKKQHPGYLGAVGKKGRAKGGHVTGKGGLDFEGNIGLFSVSIEAKSTTTGSVPFGETGIKKHQQVACKHRHEEGAIAFFLVEVRKRDQEPRYYAVPWPVLAPLWRRYEFPTQEAPYVASIGLKTLETECPRVNLLGKHLDLVGLVQEMQVRRATEGGAA